MLTGAKNPEVAIQELFDQGIKTIVHKQAADGSRYIAQGSDFLYPAFAVSEIDPTGAGDSFGDAFTTHWLANQDPIDCLKVATAAGALAVQQRGPMEGTSSYAEIQSFIAAHSI